VVTESFLVDLAMGLGLKQTEEVVRAQVRRTLPVILATEIVVDAIFSPWRLR